VINNLNDITG